MLMDTFNCLKIIFVIAITFIGFIIPGCASSDSKKKAKSAKVKSLRKDGVSPSKRGANNSSQMKKAKEDSKKDNKDKKDCKQESSKNVPEPKDDNNNITCNKKDDVGSKKLDATKELSLKESSKKKGDKEEKSPKETPKKDEKEETSLKGTPKKVEKEETSLKGTPKKVEDKGEKSHKDNSKKQELSIIEDHKQEGSKKEDGPPSLKEMPMKDATNELNNNVPKKGVTEKKEESKKKDQKCNEIKPNMEKIVFEKGTGNAIITLENKTDLKRAIKIKCSDNNLYKVNPVFQYIESGKTISVEVIRSGDQKKVDKLVVLNTPATVDGHDPQKEFKSGEKYTSIVIPLAVA